MFWPYDERLTQVNVCPSLDDRVISWKEFRVFTPLPHPHGKATLWTAKLEGSSRTWSPSPPVHRTSVKKLSRSGYHEAVMSMKAFLMAVWQYKADLCKLISALFEKKQCEVLCIGLRFVLVAVERTLWTAS